MTRKISTQFANVGEAEAQFRQRIAGLNLRGVKVAAILAITLVPLFSFLDFYVLNPLFLPLAGFRMAVGTYCGVIWALSRRPSAYKHNYFYGASEVVVVSLAIAIMVHVHDALAPESSPSHYYAGIILVVVAAGQLFTWTLRQSIVVFAIVYLGYLVPTVVLQPPADQVLFLSHNFFLLATIVIATVGQYFSYNLQMREFLASFDLEAANKQLEKANEKLTEMDKFKTQFFSNITHELRTPLTLILAPAEAVLNGEIGEFSESQQEYFRRIYHNGLKLMKLINDLLDLSKLEDSKLKLRIDEMDLAGFLEGLTSNIKPLADRKNIELRFEVSGTDTLVWGDMDRLERVFINLLANAVKFTDPEGAITVHLDATGDTLDITVKDTGIGIPRDKLDIIFDRFSQVDGTTTRRFGGTGIGLALAKELTELHGGRIRAESMLKHGTTMFVEMQRGKDHFRPDVLDRRHQRIAVPDKRRTDDGSLPQWSAQFQEKAEYKYLDVSMATERRRAPRDEKGRLPETAARILIVEDSKEMLQFLHLQLREWYAVYLAENGRKGWELVEKLKPDLVVTDFMMPEMDGLELTHLIKSNKATSHIPVVMLTAKTATGDRIAGKEAGADEYLSKPFSTSELLAVLRALLKNREEQAERMLSQRLDSLQVVAARMAHEIHNPLNYIRNGAILARKAFNRMLSEAESGVEDAAQSVEKRRKSGARVEKMLDQIEVGTQRVSNAVDLLKEYAREGYANVERPYDVDKGIESVMKVVLSSEGTPRQVSFAPRDVGEVKCVPQEFHEIVSNLIQNAIDATPEGGNIAITSGREGDNIVISVRDNGEGIEREIMDKVFSPFFTTKEPGRGMGMGLTIVYRLVRKYGGKIDVHSEVGQGTTFVVTLPAFKAGQETNQDSGGE